MFKTVKRIIDWCGKFKGRLYAGFVVFVLFPYFRGHAADGGGLHGGPAHRCAENRRGV